jgi:peptidoglycan/LPS O-acetylase OafA/YrhL
MKAAQRSPQIQALRAIASILVLLFHAKFIAGGYIGVDIFYVISGFLITGLLVRELEATTQLDFAKFYARRFKRLLPSSALVLASTGVAGFLIYPAAYRHEFGRDLVAAAAYISNVLFASWNNDYQNLGAMPSPFIHYWSLAVEEQFYLFWPLFIVLLYKLGGRILVRNGIFVVSFLSFIYSLYLTSHSPIWSFYLLPTRAWELGIGAILLFAGEFKRISRVSIPLSLSAIAITSLVFDESTSFPGLAAVLPVVATALLIANREHWPLPVNAFSKMRPIQWLGEISYPLYLWHWPLLVLPAAYFSRPLTLIEKSLCIGATVLLAALTNLFVEEKIRYRSWAPTRTFRLATFVTLLSVSLGIGIMASYSNTSTFDNGKSYNLEEVRRKPINDLDGCHIHVRQTTSPRCEYGDINSSDVIVLYGDSHAAQWLPALDLIGRKYGIKIVSLTKSSCPSAEVIKELSSQYVVTDCQEFRNKSVTRISRIRPMAVIMTGMQPEYEPYSNRDGSDWWLKGEAKALARIKSLTAFPIYITDTPLPQRDIPTCLSQKLGSKCDHSKPMSPLVAPGFETINPTPWLCTQTCPAIIDGVVTYRDQSHISVDMSKHLAPRLAEELIGIGVIPGNSR